VSYSRKGKNDVDFRWEKFSPAGQRKLYFIISYNFPNATAANHRK